MVASCLPFLDGLLMRAGGGSREEYGGAHQRNSPSGQEGLGSTC